MAILLTGFSAFPGAPFNPTDDLARALAERDPERLTTLVLPVDWRHAWAVLAAAIEARRPRSVVMFGLAAGASRVRIERLARNRREAGRPDQGGVDAGGPVIADGAETLACRMPERRIAAALRRGRIPFEWSDDAGGYLCNDTLYRLCERAGALGLENWLFVHVPLSEERAADWKREGAWRENQPTLPATTIARAAEAIVAALT